MSLYRRILAGWQLALLLCAILAFLAVLTYVFFGDAFETWRWRRSLQTEEGNRAILQAFRGPPPTPAPTPYPVP